ncbi:MAG: acyl-CoA thioesterase [Clostridia bacterium]
MKNVFEHTVRSTEVDVIGHVHHAKYLEYMEWARNGLMDDIGFTLDEMMRRHTLPVIVSLTINYRRELKMNDSIKVLSWMVKTGTKSFTMRHEVLNPEGELACDAEVILVLIDGQTRKSIELPDELKRSVEV